MTRGVLQLGLLALVFHVALACTQNKPNDQATDAAATHPAELCPTQEAQCISDTAGRLCSNGAHAGWVYFVCDVGEACRDGGCVFSDRDARSGPYHPSSGDAHADADTDAGDASDAGDTGDASDAEQ
jgi:hypothetical protein